MPITGTWKNPALGRCDRKRVYLTMARAERVAERQSLQSGELLLAYPCFDCGRFHVGHADLSQQIIRQEPVKALNVCCPRCQKPVPEERRAAATASGAAVVYCTRRCGERYRKAIRHACRRESQNANA